MGLTRNIVHGANAERMLLLLHGLGADEGDLAQLVGHLDPDGRFLAVLLRGQYSAPPGFAWFDFGSPDRMVATLETSVRSVNESFEEACRDYGMRREEAVIGGFSQGAVVSFAIGLRRDEYAKPAGILAMSGYLPGSDKFIYDWASAPPVLLQHGSQDQLIPVDAARASATALESNGVPVTYREYEMEHQVTLDSVRDAAAWLGRIVAGERPSEPLPAAVREAAQHAEAAAQHAGAEAEAPPPPPDDGPVRTVTAQSFEAEVLRSDTPVIVDFWAPWCQPCKAIAPIMEQIAVMRKGNYKVVKLNIDEAPAIAQQYQIQSIPMVALFRNGRMERTSVGVKPRPQLEAELGMLVIP
jgi:thioredoxin 1